MPKSKNRKNHQEQLNKYKSNKKKEQELFKKKMIDNYMKMQQENLANRESHSSVEEVSGPEINIDELMDNLEVAENPPFDVNADVEYIEVEAKEFTDEIDKPSETNEL